MTKTNTVCVVDAATGAIEPLPDAAARGRVSGAYRGPLDAYAALGMGACAAMRSPCKK